VSAPFDVSNHIDAVTAMVRAAGDRALEWFRRPMTVDNKLADAASRGAHAFDPVTEADRAVEDALRAALEARFPDHRVLGEERGLSGVGDPLWVIDPIDGTRAFITGQPLWGTLLGLRLGDRMLAGWLHNPVLQETYVGAGGQTIAHTNTGTTTLHTRSLERLTDAIVLCTHPDMFAPGPEADAFARLDRATRMIRYSGDCMNYALLAAGFADLVVENRLQSYDVAALIPIVEGAGGVITDLEGQSPVEGGYVVAAGSRRLHEQALAVLTSDS
jgi:myo-inositol-1(or 4)-monophosphatase